MIRRKSRQTADRDEAAATTLRRIGEALRAAREARGDDVYDVADYLRIKPSYLIALEQGDLSMTPGRAYALGFVRSYGDFLGFDSAQVVEAVKNALDARVESAQLIVRQPASDDRRPGGVVIAASILLAGVLYATWHVAWRDEPLLDRVAALPGEVGRVASGLLNPPGTGSSQSAAPAAPSAGSAGRERTALAGSAEPGNPAAPARGSAVSASAHGLLLAAPADEGRNYVVQPALPPAASDRAGAFAAEAQPAPARGVIDRSGIEILAALDSEAPRSAAPVTAAPDARVTLVARESSWVQIRSPGRDFVRTRTLEPGERFALPNRQDLALWTGNAGGLEVLVDGRSLGVLGDPGKVARDVPLAPDALKARAGTLRTP